MLGAAFRFAFLGNGTLLVGKALPRIGAGLIFLLAVRAALLAAAAGAADGLSHDVTSLEMESRHRGFPGGGFRDYCQSRSIL
jgi:hypothetical protein